MEFDIHVRVLLSVFVVALVMGATMAKTNFCTMGAVSDLVNFGDGNRMRAWLLGGVVAAAGVLVLELAGVVQVPGDTLPPYRTAQFAWLRYLLGGFMFGIGMTLGSGCATRTLIRIGSGNLKSLVVAAMIALVAWAFYATELFDVAVMSWLAPTIVDLGRLGIAGQNVDAVVAGATGLDAKLARLLVGGLVVLVFAWLVLRSAEFRASRHNVAAGVVLGLAVLAGWFITGGPFAEEWREYAMFADERPSRVGVQSFTFVNPIGDAARWLSEPTRTSQINFGIMGVLGVVAGSLAWALATRSFRLEWFGSLGDFLSHVAGGLLMGFGGVLAMGCTIGQGVTGVSTLAIGSFLALGALIAGAAVTMKVQYALIE